MIPLLLSGVSLACGGLFCTAITYDSQAVNQSAEEILFSMDEEAGEVTTVVKIFYEGPVDSFSWVVPVPSVPELESGTNALFDALHGIDARFALTELESGCSGSSGAATGTGTGWFSSTAATTYGYGYVPGVEVVATEAVGPYETVVLAADDSTALTAWLSINDYAVPAGFDPAVAPYIAGGQVFVAMKLAKDKDVGDMTPLVMRYPSDRIGIPLTLTSVAAVPDMRLRVYVLGEHRAVPENYLHVQLNGFGIDWWSEGSNYEAHAGIAADEAGGHAFATDYAGSGAGLAREVFEPGWDALALDQAADAFEFLTGIAQSGLPADDALMAVLTEWIPVPPELAGTSPEALYGCPSCYEPELRAQPFDPAGAAADLEDRVLGPRRAAAELLTAHPVLTRLTSSASPNEMTVDPIFVFNPDMEQSVAAEREAVLTTSCDGERSGGSPRELQLPDGRVVQLPARDAMTTSDFEYLAPLHLPAALIIERTSAAGEPEVLVDNTALFDQQLDAFNGGSREEPRGCGCDGTGGLGWAWAWLLLPLAGRRRGRISSWRG